MTHRQHGEQRLSLDTGEGSTGLIPLEQGRRGRQIRLDGAADRQPIDTGSLESEGHVATLWLDRVDARNAMGRDLWRDLPRAAAFAFSQMQLAQRPVIVYGAGCRKVADHLDALDA